MTKKRDDGPENHTYDIKAKVVSIGQKGGQTAGTIYNVGQQKRTFKNVDISGLLGELSKYAGTKVIVAAVGMDSEIGRFAQEIRNLLKGAGWDVARQAVSFMGSTADGVILQAPESLPESLVVLENSLRQYGFKVFTQTDTKKSMIHILVGAS